MNTQPLISVIVPVYNGERFVKRCLENLLRQSYQRLEIIVVDDGSRDNSAAIAREFPVRLISFEKNRGLSAARNAGIEQAGGSYIHFMDVDDSINDSFYEKLAQAVMDTDADVACAGMVNDKRPHRSIVFNEQLLLTTAREKLKATNVGKRGYVWRYLFKKSFLLQYNLRFEEGRFIEDLPFSLTAVYFASKLVVVPGAEYNYHSHDENSIMNRKDKAHRKKRRGDWQHVKDFRYQFARKHRIKIPGVPTSPWLYYYVKWFK